jgi:serine/threonine protein phosphatase PrpC
MLQIGDGDLLLGYPDGRVESPLRPDQGLTGEETYSLCQEDAEARFRFASMWRSGGVAWPDFALLASDGVSKSFRDDDAFRAAAAQLREVAGHDWQATLEALPDWLADVSQNGSGDDATLCMAIRRVQDQESEESES